MKAEHLLPLLLWLVSCGGEAASAPPPETPPAPPPAAAAEKPPASPAAASTPAASIPAASTPAATSPSTSPALAANSPAAAAPAKVEFPPHASVEAAIKAVPQGAARMNMADDALRAPLLELKRYDQCKVPRSTRVTMTVAVYDGAAVGVDLTTKPKNAKIEECVDGVVRGMTWTKVPSLNTVNVNF